MMVLCTFYYTACFCCESGGQSNILIFLVFGRDGVDNNATDSVGSNIRGDTGNHTFGDNSSNSLIIDRAGGGYIGILYRFDMK
jgi:hypothetical protein